MITTLHIRNLRGIRKLDAEGLGRFNLVIGRNESGKTTFLAAAGFQSSPDAWDHIAPYLDDPRGGDLEFERHWLPLFPGGDPEAAVQIWGTNKAGELAGWRMDVSAKRGKAGWPARLTADPGDGRKLVGTLTDDGVLDWKPRRRSPNRWWAPAFVEPESAVFDDLLDLYKAGRMGEIIAPLREVNPNIESVEVAGENVFVRLHGYPLPLRFGVLGDGARRFLEFAIALADSDVDLLLIDELENGFHYSTLPTVFRMLQSDPRRRQIFATTHRDELIRVACEVFLERKDDGLRIIRLDRGEDEHRAVVYTAEQALAGMDSGLELRG